jgi:hypothetical protein
MGGLRTGSCIWYGAKQERPFLGFDMKVVPISSMSGEEKVFHYVYVCKKLSGADQKCKDNFEKVMKELQLQYEEEMKYMIN